MTDEPRNIRLATISKANESLTRINSSVVVFTVVNLIFLLLCFISTFFVFSALNAVENNLSLVITVQMLAVLGFIVLAIPIVSSVAVIVLLALRELRLREGRVIFEFLGEKSHKFSSERGRYYDNPEEDGADDTFFQIKLFAINESLPLVRSGIAPIIYIVLNLATTTSSFILLFFVTRALSSSVQVFF